MLTEDLARIRELKTEATALRNRGEYDRAIKTLDDVIGRLDLLKPSNAGEARDIRSELADTLGMKGGVYRRWNKPGAALEQYQLGAIQEEKDALSTYNASNVITLAITEENRHPDDPDLVKMLDAVIRDLDAKTASMRQDEWWAWSDLGQFYLLRNKSDLARKSYERAVRTGASTRDIERHIEILETLHQATIGTAPEVARAIDDTLQMLRPYVE